MLLQHASAEDVHQLVVHLMTALLVSNATSSATVVDHIAPSVSRLATNARVIRHNLPGVSGWLAVESFAGSPFPSPRRPQLFASQRSHLVVESDPIAQLLQETLPNHRRKQTFMVTETPDRCNGTTVRIYKDVLVHFKYQEVP